ncbi:MAG: hypothetical protein ACHQ5A_13055 [Opitutales bacterium]
MNTILKYTAAKASALLPSFPAVLAQTQWSSVSDLKTGVGQIAGMLIIISWLFALIAWFVGAAAKESNPAMSKYCFYIVWMFAIGGPVVGLIFKLFAGTGAAVTPTFQ